MKSKALILFTISFLLSSCSNSHNYLEIGQSYKTNFSSSKCYYDIVFKEKDDNTVLLEISRFGDENLGIVYNKSFEAISINGIEKDYVTTQSPVGAKQIYIVDFIDEVATAELVFNSTDFEKICIETTTAVNWAEEGSYNAIIIHTN